MLVAIAIIGFLVCLGSLIGIAVPARLIGVVRAVMSDPRGLYFAAIVRLVLGVLMILAAPASLFPVVFRVIGVIAVLAALAIPVMGRARLERFVDWFAAMPAAVIRGWLIFAFAFGAFLVYGTGLV